MTAWTGISVGGVLGGVLVFILTRKKPDVGVIGAAAAAVALIGGAITAKPASAETK